MAGGDSLLPLKGGPGIKPSPPPLPARLHTLHVGDHLQLGALQPLRVQRGSHSPGLQVATFGTRGNANYARTLDGDSALQAEESMRGPNAITTCAQLGRPHRIQWEATATPHGL